MGTPMEPSIEKPGEAPRRGLVRRAVVAALVACALLLWALMVLSIPFPARAAEEFLDPEAAFRVAARAADEGHVGLQIDIAPVDHLYRDRRAIASRVIGYQDAGRLRAHLDRVRQAALPATQ